MSIENWYVRLCNILGSTPEQTHNRLSAYRENMMGLRPDASQVNPKTLIRWKNESNRLTARGATFILDFLKDQNCDITTQQYQDFIKLLNTRKQGSRPRRKKFHDPFSLAVQREIPKKVWSTKQIEKIEGLHRLVRYNSHDKCLVSDILQITNKNSRIGVHLISENGIPYSGQCTIIETTVYITLVSLGYKRTVKPVLGQTIRNIVLRFPQAYDIDTIAGIMLRSTSNSGAPISSLVILDKVHSHDSNFMSAFPNQSIISNPARSKEVLSLNQLIGPVSQSHPYFENYIAALSDEDGEIVEPQKTSSLAKIGELFPKSS